MVSGCGGMRPHLAGAVGGAGPRICHCEERSDVGISCNSPRIRRGFLVIQLSTARLPRPLRGLAMTNLRTGAVGGAISGRHCPSERAIVKTATAPDLSLRGGRRPTWQSREGTSSSYKVPIKTYQPIASVAAPSERLAGWQVIEWLRRPRNAPRFVIPRSEATWESRGGSCDFAGAFLCSGVYCEIATAPAEPRNDKSGGLSPSGGAQ